MMFSNAFKNTLDRVFEYAIEFLIDCKGKVENQGDNRDDDWGVWFINTKTHLMVIAAREHHENLSNLIPDDGSFISGIMVAGGLGEDAATTMVSELSENMSGEPEEPGTLN